MKVVCLLYRLLKFFHNNDDIRETLSDMFHAITISSLISILTWLMKDTNASVVGYVVISDVIMRC